RAEARLRDALKYLHPEKDEDWLHRAIEIKSLSWPEEIKYRVFDDWSRKTTDDNYDDRENRERWNSLKPHHAPPASSGDAELDAEIKRLATLPPALYERERIVIANRFEVRAPVLDKLVKAAREHGGNDDQRQGHAIRLSEPAPWAKPVDGAEL